MQLIQEMDTVVNPGGSGIVRVSIHQKTNGAVPSRQSQVNEQLRNAIRGRFPEFAVSPEDTRNGGPELAATAEPTCVGADKTERIFIAPLQMAMALVGRSGFAFDLKDSMSGRRQKWRIGLGFVRLDKN